MSVYSEEIWEREMTDDGIMIDRMVPMDKCIAKRFEIWHYDVFETFAQEMILNIKHQFANVLEGEHGN